MLYVVDYARLQGPNELELRRHLVSPRMCVKRSLSSSFRLLRSYLDTSRVIVGPLYRTSFTWVLKVRFEVRGLGPFSFYSLSHHHTLIANLMVKMVNGIFDFARCYCGNSVVCPRRTVCVCAWTLKEKKNHRQPSSLRSCIVELASISLQYVGSNDSM